MSTTAIFVEILVIGVQAAVWVTILVLNFFGYDWFVISQSSLEKWTGLLTIFIIAFCYTLGIVVDRVADGFFMIVRPLVLVKPRNLLMKFRWVKDRFEKSSQDKRMQILIKEDKATECLEYIRSRLRIMRATVLNLVLILISTLLFISNRCVALGCNSTPTLINNTLSIGIPIVLISYIAWAMIQTTYDDRLAQTSNAFEIKPKQRRNKSAPKS
jgi:hypothetical protein